MQSAFFYHGTCEAGMAVYTAGSLCGGLPFVHDAACADMGRSDACFGWELRGAGAEAQCPISRKAPAHSTAADRKRMCGHIADAEAACDEFTGSINRVFDQER